MLDEFKKWNEGLEYLIPSLLVSFGFYSDTALPARLTSDNGINVFEEHLKPIRAVQEAETDAPST